MSAIEKIRNSSRMKSTASKNMTLLATATSKTKNKEKKAAVEAKTLLNASTTAPRTHALVHRIIWDVEGRWLKRGP